MNAPEHPDPPGWVVDEEDFAAWVAPHLEAMCRLAARLAGSPDRDDVVQDSLTRAWKRRTTYDAARGGLRAWLLAIVADQARRHRSRRGIHRLPLTEVAADPRPADVDLERAVRGLPDRQRMTVELYYFVGLTMIECAGVLGCSEGTVKSNLHDARSKLRMALGEDTQ